MDQEWYAAHWFILESANMVRRQSYTGWLILAHKNPMGNTALIIRLQFILQMNFLNANMENNILFPAAKKKERKT